MRRYLLRFGDKSTNDGVVIEGVKNCTHRGKPITFIGAKVLCPCCKSEGVIGSRGPHQKATMHGKQVALDGDICLCECSPPPAMLASQDTAWHEFKSHELAGTESASHSGPSASSLRDAYDEQFALTDGKGKPLPDTYYTVRLPSGELIHGMTDSQGRTLRYPTESAQSVVVYLGHKQEA